MTIRTKTPNLLDSPPIPVQTTLAAARRLPARHSRWRFWSPEDASIGAVPFQDAKCAAVQNRLMSPMSPMSRAALTGRSR